MEVVLAVAEDPEAFVASVQGEGVSSVILRMIANSHNKNDTSLDNTLEVSHPNAVDWITCCVSGLNSAPRITQRAEITDTILSRLAEATGKKW